MQCMVNGVLKNSAERWSAVMAPLYRKLLDPILGQIRD